jgi:hypothetical protein
MGDSMADREIKDEQPRVYFNCSKCPAFCCSIYERVEVTKRDLNRLARHFRVTPEVARERYTRDWEGERVLNRVDDVIFPKTCMFLDQQTRGTTPVRLSAAPFPGARAVPITISSSSSASSRATRPWCPS